MDGTLRKEKNPRIFLKYDITRKKRVFIEKRLPKKTSGFFPVHFTWNTLFKRRIKDPQNFMQFAGHNPEKIDHRYFDDVIDHVARTCEVARHNSTPASGRQHLEAEIKGFHLRN